MKRNIYAIFLLFTFISSGMANATTRRVLFIGNSYLHTNDVPNLVRQLALSLGDTLVYDQSTPGGHTLQLHCSNTTTINKIYSQQWDVVVVHEQSQRPAFPPAQVQTDTYPYAHILDSLIHDNNSCTQTMFMMTWGYKNGDPSNCGSYPVICTYEGMQMRLRESYLEMTQDNNAVVAPVGTAWKVTRDSFPSIELYSNDNSHPVIAGSYLEACVLYASIFHKAPNLSNWYSTVPQSDAVKLQNVATHVVMDSLDSWQQHGNYTYAGFARTINDKTITLQNNSAKATAYAWNFGDLNTSTLQSPPPHTYAQYGQYVVTLTASNSCFSETAKDTLNIAPTSVAEINGEIFPVQIATQGQGKVAFSVSGETERLELYTADGRKLRSYTIKGNTTISEELPAGIYLCRAWKADKVGVVKFSVL